MIRRDVQVYNLDGTTDGTTLVFPKQERPFRLLSVCTTFGTNGTATTSRVIELRASFGNVAPFLRICCAALANNITGSLNWFAGADSRVIDYNASTQQQHIMPLPTDMVIDPNVVLSLVWDGADDPLLDVLGPTVVMIDRL